MKILVTGGHGMLGKSIQKLVKNNLTNNHEYFFISRKECDFRDANSVHDLFNQLQPEVVIHLASCVGGVYQNMNNNYNYLTDNVRIHLNVVDCCDKYNVKRLINILSTCIFPNENVTYPLTSDQLHNGLPHDSNIGYAYSKRFLHVASGLLQQKNMNTKVVNITPTNLYGENDNYDLKSAHVIPSLIHKMYLAKKNNTPIEVCGTGNALRQFLYVDDLAKVVIAFIDIELDKNKISAIVSPPEKEEYRIKELIEMISEIYEYDKRNITYNGSYSDGQEKKTTNEKEVAKYIKDIEFTELREGLQKTIKAFKYLKDVSSM